METGSTKEGGWHVLTRFCRHQSCIIIIYCSIKSAKFLQCFLCQAPVSMGIPQARILEWVAISFSNAWKWKVKVKSLSRVRLFATPWTAAYQAPPPMGFSRQEYWSGVPLPSLDLYIEILSIKKYFILQLKCFNESWSQFFRPQCQPVK